MGWLCGEVLLWKEMSICRFSISRKSTPGPRGSGQALWESEGGAGAGSLIQTGGFEDVGPFLSGEIQLTLTKE